MNQQRLRDGWTPLFLASVFGNSSMVRSDFWTLYVWQMLYGQVRLYLLDVSENLHFRPNLSEDLQQCVCLATPLWSGQIALSTLNIIVLFNKSAVLSRTYNHVTCSYCTMHIYGYDTLIMLFWSYNNNTMRFSFFLACRQFLQMAIHM